MTASGLIDLFKTQLATVAGWTIVGAPADDFGDHQIDMRIGNVDVGGFVYGGVQHMETLGIRMCVGIGSDPQTSYRTLLDQRDLVTKAVLDGGFVVSLTNNGVNLFPQSQHPSWTDPQAVDSAASVGMWMSELSIPLERSL